MLGANVLDLVNTVATFANSLKLTIVTSSLVLLFIPTLAVLISIPFIL